MNCQDTVVCCSLELTVVYRPHNVSVLSEHLCVFGLHGAIYVLNFFLLTSFSLPFTELSLVRLALDLVD